MIDKIIISIIFALISWVEKRIEKGKIAIDSDLDFDRLRNAGTRIDAWLQQNGVSNGGKPSSSGSQN